jgi:hypothetical protein
MCRSRPRGVADDLRQSRPEREVKARPDVFALIWNLRLERCLASKGVSARNRSDEVVQQPGSRVSVGTPGSRAPTPPDDPHRQDGSALWAVLS